MEKFTVQNKALYILYFDRKTKSAELENAGLNNNKTRMRVGRSAGTIGDFDVALDWQQSMIRVGPRNPVLDALDERSKSPPHKKEHFWLDIAR